MADLIDIVNTLVLTANSALYPTGAAPCVAGVDVTLAAGWPVPKQLDAIIAAGNAMLTVYPLPGMDQNVTRFLNEEQQTVQTPVASLTLTVSGNQVTVGGTIQPGEAAMVAVNRVPYTHAVTPVDTIATIAAALAALIPGASASGAVVTVGGSVFEVDAAVSALANLQTEVARQKRVFILTAWCPSFETRDLIVQAVDLSLKTLPGRRLLLPDNTWGIVIYRGTLMTDDLATRKIYRRDLRYEVEYATTQQSTSNTITNTQTTLTPSGGAAVTIYNP